MRDWGAIWQNTSVWVSYNDQAPFQFQDINNVVWFRDFLTEWLNNQVVIPECFTKAFEDDKG